MPRVHRVDELAELVERSRELVELRHRGVDGEEVGRGERAAVLAHYGVGRRNGERGERLHDAEAHPVHYDVEPPRDFAEGPELAREDGVDRVVRARLRALDLDVRVASVGPLGDVRPLGEEARLAGEDADLVERDVGGEHAGRDLGKRDVGPRLRERRLAALRLGDYLAPPHAGVADVGPERRASLPRRVEPERY